MPTELRDSSWLLVVQATIPKAVEEAWNEWYDLVHLPEILECPGFIAGARYVVEGLVTPDGVRSEETVPRYFTVYWIESQDALSSPEHRARAGWGEFSEHVQYEARLLRPLTRRED